MKFSPDQLAELSALYESAQIAHASDSRDGLVVICSGGEVDITLDHDACLGIGIGVVVGFVTLAIG